MTRLENSLARCACESVILLIGDQVGLCLTLSMVCQAVSVDELVDIVCQSASQYVQ